MTHSPLGRTGLSVSRLSLGGAQFGQQYGPVSTAQAAEVVHAAIDAGMNLIDTSAYYGKGTSEAILGEVLAGGRRERVILCTKAGRLDRREFDFTPAGMRASVEQSLKRLRTDCVDVLLAHDIEFADDFERVFTDTADVLHRLKAEGKTRFVGMSCYPLGLLKLAIERCQLDVVISYCHFNLQDRTLLSELLPTATEHGVGVLNASPLGMGLLTNQGPQQWHPGGEGVKAACKTAAELCRTRGADISELGMQFCASEPNIPSTITGAASADELRTNLRALTEPIDADLLRDVEAVLAPVRDHTWANGNWKS